MNVHPYWGEDFQFDEHIFFKWVETTNLFLPRFAFLELPKPSPRLERAERLRRGANSEEPSPFVKDEDMICWTNGALEVDV